MPVFTSLNHHSPRHSIPALAISMLALTAPATVRAATIQEGDVTATLGPTFFVDDAALGGSDTDISHGSTASFLRLFNGLLTPNQGPTRIVLTGFGFATHTEPTANDATSVAVTFTYLGADAAVGGGDDVPIGAATGSFTFAGGKEYVFAFDTPLAADLTITGTKFRIQVAPAIAGYTGPANTALKLKTGTLVSEPAVTGTKLSVAGVATSLINPQRVNLAKFQAVTPSSVAGQRLASYLTDGVTGNDNRWQGSSSTWQSVVVDFPFPVEVGSAQVFTGVDDTLPIGNYGLQFWNGTAWTNIDGGSASGNTSVERNLVFSSPATASSFRLISAEGSLRVRELALYPPNGPGGYPLGTDLTVNLAYQRPAVASSFSTGNYPLKAVDGRSHVGSAWQTTTAGVNTLEIEMVATTKIGSAHLYSGMTGTSPLADFTLKYWNGTSWLDIPGGVVTGNSSTDRIITFTTPVSTTRVRLEFTKSGTTPTVIRELQIFPANTGNVGYALGTNINPSGAYADYEDFNDAFYQIVNLSSNRDIAVATGGQPALEQAGTALAQTQYQVLLNLSNGTYRLRNRETGNCLSGAQLSKTAGAALTDAPYVALPHQDWILEPLGGGLYKMVNVWSGLVMDTQGGATAAGTSLVQNTASNATTQRWRFHYDTWAPKKGVGGSNFANPLNAKWLYNWGQKNPVTVPAGTIYHPMQWGSFNWTYGTTPGPIWQYYPAWRTRGDGIHFMGFNEPDRTDQSNIPLADCVTLWPQLMALDQPLVSPSPGTLNPPAGPSWHELFHADADRLGYRVEYNAIHTYPSPNSGSSDHLVNLVQTEFNNFKRPVWLTEFSFVDWGGNQSWSEEDNYQCLAEFLWRAENLTALRKYALFVFTADTSNPQPANPWTNYTPAPRSNSFDSSGKPTAFGKLYAAWDNDTTIRTDKTYIIHHKGTRKRLANLLASGPDGRSIRVDDTSVNWTLASTGTSGKYYAVSSRDGRRLSSAGGAAPTLAAAGTSGANVEWTLAESRHGWFYLENPASPASNRRLQLSYNNSSSTATYSMVPNSTTTEAVQWRFIVPAPSPVWTGTASSSWADANPWFLSNPPDTGDLVTFNDKSVANLTTTLDQNFNLSGLLVQNPSGPVSVGGTHTLTLGASGIDLSAATQNLTISAPSVLSAVQTWNVASGRNLAVNGGITGSFALSISGRGTTSLGGMVDPATPLTIALDSTLKTAASAVLASGVSAANPILNGTLDLNGTAQSINFLSGSGVISNTAVSPASLTIGNNNAGGTLSTVLQNPGGPLTLIKTGTAALTLPIANTHSGGFTNNGSGNITPQHNAAFGSGPVVMNGATIYATAANYTYNNSLTLHGAILRVGGGNSRTLTWTGPVTATGASGISADGGTTGVILDGSLDISGATFTSTNTSLNTINGSISGAGGNLVALGTNGVLQVAGNNTYGGTTTIGDGSFLRLTATGTLPPSSNIINNGGLTIRNTVSWTHTGTITGDGSASIGLNAGTNATLSGNISGITTINVDNAGTDTTISGAIGGAADINIQSTVDANGVGAILRLAGANTYSGTTTISRGKLVLAAANVLPNTTAVSIGNATLDVGTFTDTAGTLDVTSPLSTIQLGTGAALAFANSSAVIWSGGSLRIDGPFVSGASIRFGTSAAGLTSTQLGLITVNGTTGPFILNSNGFLIAPVTNPYDIWKTRIANGQDGRTEDADGDGFSNQHEFLFGTSPVAGTGSLTTTTPGPGTLVLRWLQRETGATYALNQSTTLAAGSWTTIVSAASAKDSDQNGAPAEYDFHTVTLPATGERRFFRIEGGEN